MGREGLEGREFMHGIGGWELRWGGRAGRQGAWEAVRATARVEED